MRFSVISRHQTVFYVGYFYCVATIVINFGSLVRMPEIVHHFGMLSTCLSTA